MNRPLILCILFLYSGFSSEAQNEQFQDIPRDHESQTETELVRNDQALEEYQYFDAIEQYTKSPLRLNNASMETLSAFPFFSKSQVIALIEHRERYGDICTIEELQVMEEFDGDFIRQIKPLVTVGNIAGQRPITTNNIISNGDNSVLLRVQKKINEPESSGSFPGSNEKIYLRYKYQFDDRIRFGLTAEKDPGETLFKGKNSAGFDFYSGHLIIKSKSIIRQITLGDYAMQFGQGLVMWSGLGFGKGSEVINIQKNPGGVKPYTSVDENNFLRGICLTTNFHKWNSNIFYSSHLKDGNLISVDGVENISAFQTSGYHRTDAELDDRKSIRETIAGINTVKTIGNLNIGGILYLSRFSKMLTKKTALYNQFEFQGDENINGGIYYNYLFKNINTFGEFGLSKNGGLAALFGTTIHLHPKLSYAFLIRNYQKNYQALLSSGFGENSKTANEFGLFSSAQLLLPKKFTLSFYLDHFIFPWLKFGVDAPSSGMDYLIQLKWKPKRTFESYLLYKSQYKEENTTMTSEKIHLTEARKHSSLRWNIRIKLNETWDWGSRIEHSIYKKGDAKNQMGLMLSQDILFHPLNSPIAIGIRYAVFDTDDYDTRIYAYENDVLFSYSIPALQGRGSRMYINLRYRFGRMLDVWLRYSVTNYLKENPSTETPDGIKAPAKELKLQARLRF